MPWWLNALAHPRATYQLYRAVARMSVAAEAADRDEDDPTDLIPGRPGEEVDSGGGSFIPPMRPTPPRRIDLDDEARARDPRRIRPVNPRVRGQ